MREHLLARVAVAANGCWEWTATRVTGGYGFIWQERVMAHRASYEEFIGPIPEGLTLDHLCRNRRCINPEHLEPVTHRVNILRGVGLGAKNSKKTHCPEGHEYDLVNKRGYRQCVRCKNARNRESDRRTRKARAVLASLTQGEGE